ncbi:MAG: Lhr family helicase, partial [Candidatus Dormibacteria bacterium]
TWLDQLCLSGEVAWGRLRARPGAEEEESRSSAFPSRSTPVSLVVRQDLPWLLRAVRGDEGPRSPELGATAEVVEALRQRGALFIGELVQITGRLPQEVEGALWDGVARGLLSADGFGSARSLLNARWRSRPRALGLRRGAGGFGGEGRWGLLPEPVQGGDTEELAEALAEQLLVRWGVVFHGLLARENFNLPWREVLWALRRMEARGTVRGGRFASGFSGEQYALPEAVEMLRSVRRNPRNGQLVRVAAADPLNLVGIVVPGERVSAARNAAVEFLDGLPREGGMVGAGRTEFGPPLLEPAVDSTPWEPTS